MRRPLARTSRIALPLSLALATAGLSACKTQSKGGEASEEAAATQGADTAAQPGPNGPALAEAVAKEGALPALRTGELAPEAHTKVQTSAKHSFTLPAKGAVSAAQFVEFEVEIGDAPTEPPRVSVEGLPGALAVGFNEATHTTVIVRAPANATLPKVIKGKVWVARGWGDSRRWHETPFEAKTEGAANDGELPERFERLFPFAGEGVGRFGSRRGQHPWGSFAAARMKAQRLGDEASKDPSLADTNNFGREPELAQLMETTSAALSLQEALQHRRGLMQRRGAPERSLDISSVEAPPLKAHPFEAMRKLLPNPEAGHQEPLADLTPADFWYLRFSDVRLLLRTLDEADAWLTPVVQILQANSETRDLSKRYQGQLGLRRTELARALGNQVIENIALVGSDPYLREGSDLSIIFKAKQLAVLEAELGRQLEARKAEVSGAVQSSFAVRGHTVQAWLSPNEDLRRYHVVVGEHLVLSNSKAAITRILDVADKTQPSLGSTPELAFMLARDPEDPDAFAFFSDAFIGAVVGPQQKILQARRQLALADLLVPGYAALLYGWLEGKSPADVAALRSANLLADADLKHEGGESIRFSPGQAARSSWGSVETLTPIIDLPAVTKISEREKLAYEAFARGYQNNWTTFIDPVAVSLDVKEVDGKTKASVGVRVLPLIANSEYDQIRDIVADQRVIVPDIDDGVQMVWAVGPDTGLRRELNQTARSFSGDSKIGIDWLGDWVAIGALDRKALLEVAWYELQDVQLPEPEDKSTSRDKRELLWAKRIGALPVFAMADTGNPAGVAATLTGLKAFATSAAPGMMTWGEDYQHRDVPVVRVAPSATSSDPKVKEYADTISLYYANAGGVLIFALRQDVMNTLISRALDGGLPKGADESVKAGPQFVVSAASAPDRALWAATAWSMQAGANSAQSMPRQAAEILLRGAPESQQNPQQFVALARAYFGAVPTTASGKQDWTLVPGGVGDPIHGTLWAPIFVDLPVAGSPIAELMQRLEGLRAEVGFEDEPGSGDPPGRSLSTRFELTMGPAAQ